MTQPQTIDEYKAAQAAEWGKYVAAEPIDVDGVRAFNPGNPVPTSHVERGVVSAAQVTEVSEPAKAAKTAEKKG